MCFTCLKKSSGMLTSIFPKELVLFPLSFGLFCAECEYLLPLLRTLHLTEFQSLTGYFHLVPKFLLKSIFLYAFSCFIDPTT